ncbi:class II aldolase/adducin family protein [Pseudactinotalea suaedae]|uniref:class II aldolase/adducin family protein n=1 Tax=Pseudactinotalea suaedae TaxID=1524924 RepID=UPI0012E0DB7B|nr:class II aldolase/adducin family protein [Pseudactinotalea suaedae]
MTDRDAIALREEEREAVAELLEAAHHLAGLGLSPGSSGNVSVRTGDHVLVSATGTQMGSLAPEGLSRLDLHGNLVDGPRPTKEAPLHLAFYRRSPELRCVIHLHSPAAVAASCLPPYSERSALPPITPYFVMRVGQTPLLPYAVPGSVEHGDSIEGLTFAFRAALLQNHGAVCAGTTVAAAREAAIELEAAAEVLLKLPTAGYHTLSEEQAHAVAAAHGSHWDR